MMMLLKFSSTVFLLLLLHITIILAVSEEMQELMDSLHKTCVDETGAADNLIENARKGDFADDESLKCYMKCLMTQMACIDDDGVTDPEAVIALLPDEIKATMEPVIRGCGSKKGASSCENVWLTQKCYQQGSPSTYMLP